MARSKSPAPAKSPAKRSSKSKAAASAGLDDNAHLGIAVVILVAVWYHGSGGELSLSGFAKSAKGGFKFEFTGIENIPLTGLLTSFIGKSCNFVALLHVLNSIRDNTGKGYHFNAFTQAVLATFAGVIVPKIFKGTSIAGAIFADTNGFSFAGFFAMWYFINFEIPFCPHNFKIWGTISDFGGHALETLLTLGSTIFTTNLIISAAGGPQTMFTLKWFQACTLGVLAGTAAEFFPFNKGVKFVKSEAHTHAASAAFFIASNGFGFIDHAVGQITQHIGQANPNIGEQINGFVCEPFGGVAQFVLTITILNALFGHLLAEHVPLSMKSGFDVFGLVDKLFALAQLE
jgi:hypothetical protein